MASPSLAERFRLWRHQRRQAARIRSLQRGVQLQAWLLLRVGDMPIQGLAVTQAASSAKSGVRKSASKMRSIAARILSPLRVLNPLPKLETWFPSLHRGRVTLSRRLLLSLLCLGLSSLSDHSSRRRRTLLRNGTATTSSKKPLRFRLKSRLSSLHAWLGTLRLSRWWSMAARKSP